MSEPIQGQPLHIHPPLRLSGVLVRSARHGMSESQCDGLVSSTRAPKATCYRRITFTHIHMKNTDTYISPGARRHHTFVTNTKSERERASKTHIVSPHSHQSINDNRWFNSICQPTCSTTRALQPAVACAGPASTAHLHSPYPPLAFHVEAAQYAGGALGLKCCGGGWYAGAGAWTWTGRTGTNTSANSVG